MTDVLTTIFIHASLFLLLPNMRHPNAAWVITTYSTTHVRDLDERRGSEKLSINAMRMSEMIYAYGATRTLQDVEE